MPSMLMGTEVELEDASAVELDGGAFVAIEEELAPSSSTSASFALGFSTRCSIAYSAAASVAFRAGPDAHILLPTLTG